MGIAVREEVVVRRRRADVAAYLFDASHDRDWSSALACPPPESERMERGALVHRSIGFLGRRFTFAFLVTEFEPDRLTVMTMRSPFPLTIVVELDDVSGHTAVAIRVAGEPGAFFGWATPLIEHKTRTTLQADLHRLQALLEASA